MLPSPWLGRGDVGQGPRRMARPVSSPATRRVSTARALLLPSQPSRGRGTARTEDWMNSCRVAGPMAWSLALSLVAGAPGAAQETVIGVNAFPNAKALPLHAGIATGIFAKRGLKLDLELTEGATAQRQNFAAGKFQIVHSAIDNAVYNVEVGKLDNVVLSGGDQGMNEFFVQGDVKSFADLRGRILVVDATNTAYALQLKKILAQHVAERTYDLLLDPDFGFTPDAKFLPEGYRNLMALRAEIESKQATPNSGAGYVDLSYYDNAMKLVGK